ncbi:MAG TPA: hypothetical protein VEA61_11560 [Allosphingosinicella sp.]|nr:hypothetical protein [Allosphingosinicella sp.]
MKLRLFGTALAALLIYSAPAQAQSCQYLRNERDLNAAKMFGIAIDYPMTHGALIGCLSGDGTDDQRATCAISVLVIACLGMGEDYCSDLTSRWGRALQRHNYLMERLRAGGCAY